MTVLKGTVDGWWIFIIVGIFILIGVIVFILRKRIPGLVDYEKEDENKIAEDNLSRMLMSTEEEEKLKNPEGKASTEDEEDL